MGEPQYGTVIARRAYERLEGASGNSGHFKDFPTTIAASDAARFLRGAFLRYEGVADYRRLLMAIAADPLLGVGGEAITDPRKACPLVRSELLGACIVLRQFGLGLSGRHYEPVWRTYVEEAVIRGRIGCVISAATPAVSKASSILCAALPYIGVAIQIAVGSDENKDRLLRKLSQGGELFSTLKHIYEVDPTEEVIKLVTDWGVPEEVLSAGVVRGDVKDLLTLINALRNDEIGPANKAQLLNLGVTATPEALTAASRTAIREGYRWNWLID